MPPGEEPGDPTPLPPPPKASDSEGAPRKPGLAGGRLPGVEIGRRATAGARRALQRQVPIRARQAFRVDLAASLLAGLYLGSIFPFVNVIARDDLSASKHVLAFITAAPFIGNLFALFCARAMEGKRKLPFVTAFHIMARGAVLLCAFATDAWSFALIIGATQVIGMLATPAYAAVIKAVYPDSQRGRILSYTRGCIVLAQIGGTLASGWMLALWGYRVVFPAVTILGIGAALVFSRIYPDEEPDGDPGEAGRGPLHAIRSMAHYIWDTLGILKTDVAYRWFALSVFTFGAGNLMTIPLIPIIQVNELHISKPDLASMTNLMQLVAVAGYFYWGQYVDRYSPQRAVMLNIMIHSSIPIVYIATGFMPGASAWVLLPAFLVSGVVLAGIDLAYFNALLTFAGPSNVSRYQALQSFLLGLRGTAAPFLGSWLADVLEARGQNLRWVFVIAVVLMWIGAWMQKVAMRRQEEAQTLPSGA